MFLPERLLLPSIESNSSFRYISSWPVDPSHTLQTHSVFSGISLGPRPSTKEALRMLVRQDGITGLWKGNATNCLRVFPYNGLQFMTFDAIKRVRISVLDYLNL